MQLKGVNNQESLQRQRSAVVQHVHAQLFASSFTWFSGMEIFLHAALSMPQGPFSHFLSPLLWVSLWFFLHWYFSVWWVPVFVSFLCGAHGYNPDLNLLKHFQKTQHKLSHFMNTCILSLLFPQCWFQAFAKAQTSSKSTLKGTGRKSSQVFRKLWPRMKVVPLCHPWGHYFI